MVLANLWAEVIHTSGVDGGLYLWWDLAMA